MRKRHKPEQIVRKLREADALGGRQSQMRAADWR
jgi:hypothetical protein